MNGHPSALAAALWAIGILFVFGIFGVFLKIHYFGFTVSTDYETYIETAKVFSGENIPQTLSDPVLLPYADFAPGSYQYGTQTVAAFLTEGPGATPEQDIEYLVGARMLKPLAPLLTAALAPLLGFERAFWLQSLVFYFAFIVAMYLFAYEFCEDRFLAVLLTLMSILSYPVLKYGIDILTETGALFFYTLSLWLTLKFLKAPSNKVFWWNVALIIVGFLWKEYSAIAAAIFGFVLIFHQTLDRRSKIRYLVGLVGSFIVVNGAWEGYTLLHYHYSYASWYAQGGAPGFIAQFTPLNILKSLGAILGLAWLLVPFGLRDFGPLEPWKKLFLKIGMPTPFLSIAWGYISSRLSYVLAPPYLALAGVGMKRWSRTAQVLATIIVIAANIAWFFLSYSITL